MRGRTGNVERAAGDLLEHHAASSSGHEVFNGLAAHCAIGDDHVELRQRNVEQRRVVHFLPGGILESRPPRDPASATTSPSVSTSVREAVANSIAAPKGGDEDAMAALLETVFDVALRFGRPSRRLSPERRERC